MASPLENNPKLISLCRAVEIRKAMDAKADKLVMTNGCFDFIHAGHNFFLTEAAKLGAKLIVMLNSEESVRALKGPTRPIQGDLERAYNLAALESVDYVCIFPNPRLDAEISKIRPHIYAKAGDYSIDTIDRGEKKALEDAGTQITFLPFLPGFSSTGLINKIIAASKAGTL